jgi:CTP synthase (UTP-ammonia lyase)
MPTWYQNSFLNECKGIKELRLGGLQADYIFGRCKDPIKENALSKIAMFGGITKDYVNY